MTTSAESMLPVATTAPPPLPPPVDGRPDFLFIAGEHSGDEHAAELLAEVRTRRPDWKVACLGGPQLERAGAQLLYDLTAVSIVGFVEVVRHYGFFKQLFDRTLDWIAQYQPREICFVDYPGFNLRLAKALHARGLSRKGGGGIRLTYYIGPQVWAWKARRRFQMAELLDRLGVIFLFEVDCFRDTNLSVEFVGHPFVRPGHRLPFVHRPDGPVLLLPGSRSAAVGRIFPVLLEGFAYALSEEPELRARVVYPSVAIHCQLEAVLNRYPKVAERVEFVPKGQHEQPASAVLMSSGTMSLAVALSGIPGAIAYRLHPVSYWMGRALVNVPYIGIANLLLDRPQHPEFIQGAASPKRLGRAILEARKPEQAAAAQAAAAELRGHLSPGDGPDAAGWLIGNSE